MYKCELVKGQMIFTSPERKYIVTGKFLDSMDEVVKEHDLIQEISKDHAWAFPVIEALNRRKTMLLENLMNLYKRFGNGRNILDTKNRKDTSVTGRIPSTGSKGRSGEEKKAQGQD